MPEDTKESSEQRAASSPRPVAALVELIKPWKELIAIIAFFGGGAIWVGGYFATKHQVDKLECFAIHSLTLARAETILGHTFDEIVQKSVRIDQLEGKVKDNLVTDSDRLELKRLQRELKDLEETRKAASNRFEASEKSLKEGLCPKEK